MYYFKCFLKLYESCGKVKDAVRLQACFYKVRLALRVQISLFLIGCRDLVVIIVVNLVQVLQVGF